jgi:hypothetical protein
VGWNYLMATNPVGQAAYRSRAFLAANISLTPPAPKAIRVMVVDRGTHTRRFLNAVCACVGVPVWS